MTSKDTVQMDRRLRDLENNKKSGDYVSFFHSPHSNTAQATQFRRARKRVLAASLLVMHDVMHVCAQWTSVATTKCVE